MSDKKEITFREAIYIKKRKIDLYLRDILDPVISIEIFVKKEYFKKRIK